MSGTKSENTMGFAIDSEYPDPTQCIPIRPAPVSTPELSPMTVFGSLDHPSASSDAFSSSTTLSPGSQVPLSSSASSQLPSHHQHQPMPLSSFMPGGPFHHHPHPGLAAGPTPTLMSMVSGPPPPLNLAPPPTHHHHQPRLSTSSSNNSSNILPLPPKPDRGQPRRWQDWAPYLDALPDDELRELPGSDLDSLQMQGDMPPCTLDLLVRVNSRLIAEKCRRRRVRNNQSAAKTRKRKADELDAAVKEAACLREELQAAEASCGEAEKERDAAVAQGRGLQVQVARLEGENARLVEDNRRLREENGRLLDENGRLAGPAFYSLDSSP